MSENELRYTNSTMIGREHAELEHPEEQYCIKDAVKQFLKFASEQEVGVVKAFNMMVDGVVIKKGPIFNPLADLVSGERSGVPIGGDAGGRLEAHLVNDELYIRRFDVVGHIPETDQYSRTAIENTRNWYAGLVKEHKESGFREYPLGLRNLSESNILPLSDEIMEHYSRMYEDALKEVREE